MDPNTNDEIPDFKSRDIVKPFPYIKFGVYSTLLIFLLYQIAGGGALLALKNYRTNDLLPWVQGFGQIIMMLLPALWIASRAPIGFKEILRLNKTPAVQQWIFGILGIIALQLFAQGFVILQEHILPENIQKFYQNLEKDFEELYELLLGSKDIIGLLRALLIGALIPAVAEEFLFRGILQRSLEEAMSFKKAIIIAGIFFAVIHFNLPVLIPLICIGIYLGALAYYSGSIWLAVGAHFVNNALAVVGMYYEAEATTELPLLQAALLIALGIAGMIFALQQVVKLQRKSALRNNISDGL